jgi:hypothetical protein
MEGNWVFLRENRKDNWMGDQLADHLVDYLDWKTGIDSVDWLVVYWEWKRVLQ